MRRLFLNVPRNLVLLVGSTLLLFAPSLLFAQDTITNVMSPVVSYQYFDSSTDDTNSPTISLAVSYQFYDSLTDKGTNSVISSPVASYQYFDWPNATDVQFLSSPPVSFLYNIGVGDGSVSVYGGVKDSSGAPLSGATVSASIYQIVQASAETASDGTFTLSPLPPGVYTLQANLANYAKSARALTLSVATAQQNFKLSSLPAAPAVQQVNRQPATFGFPPIGSLGEILEIFNGTAFTQISADAAPSPNLMTIVMTHGWNSDPTVWAQGMAADMVAKGVNANILAWDWRYAAQSLFPPQEDTPAEGVLLGQSLQSQSVLGMNYSKPIHFLGHSLGTMVNAAAANYLHGDRTAQQSTSPTPWSPSQTHMTLFDQAELSAVASEQVLFDGLTVDLEDPFGVLLYAAQVLQGWAPSMPVRSTWADNYISAVGFYLPNTFNIALQDAAGILGLNAIQAHSYPMVWYSDSIETPTDSPLGFQQSYEYDLLAGLPASTFPSSDFQLGDAYHQIPSASDPLALEPLPPQDVFQAIVPFLGNTADLVVQGTVAVVQIEGNVAVDMEDSAQAGSQAVSSGMNYAENVAGQGGQTVVDLFNSAVLSLTLQTEPGPQVRPPNTNGLPHPGPQPQTMSNTPAMAWVPVQIPSTALAMAFDFKISGYPEQDSLVCGIGDTNLFSLQGQYIPTNAVSASRLIDVSAWSGQQVELFFGFMGGTSSDATLVIDNIRFFSLQPPQLNIQYVGGIVTLTWPSTASGYVLQSATDLGVGAWQDVTNAPSLFGGVFTLTNSWPDQTRFFRLNSQ